MMRIHFLLALAYFFAIGSLFGQSHIWTGNGGDQDWFNAANWSANTVPGPSSDVVIDNNFVVQVNTQPVIVANISLIDNASLTLGTDFTAIEQFLIESDASLVWNSGGFIGGAIIQNNGGILMASTSEKHLTGANLENNGAIYIISIGFLRLIDSPKITNTSTGIFEINGSGNLSHQSGNPIFDNEGLIRKLGGANAGSSYMITKMNNRGIIDVGENQSLLFLSALAELNNLETGTLSGTGTFDVTAPFVTPGTISPGSGDVGTLGFLNNFNLSPQTKLRFDIFGPNSGEYDVIAVTGFPDLDGEILIRLTYTPTIGDEFTIITASEINSCNFPAQVTSTIGTGPQFLFDVICENTFVKLRVVEEVLDVTDFSSEEYAFYVQPNPASETINIVFNASEGVRFPTHNLSLSLYNVLGQKVKTIENFSEEKTSFQRGDLSSGMYFIQLNSEEKALATTKLILK